MDSMIKFLRPRWIAALLLLGIILPAGAGWAQQSRTAGWAMPDHYPERFSGHGCLNRIEGNEVVIDDRLYKFASDATFHTPQSPFASRSGFREGARVGFVKGGDKKIESLWYIDKCY